MSEEKQVTSSTLEQSLPVKRKRGRPRKDESLKRVQKPAPEIPKSESVKRNPSRSTTLSSNRDDAFLGQEVSGVLDGSFDAGYLVTVKVVGTNTVLRGVLFDSGFVHPISEANDVASSVRMLKKNEIPSPAPTSLHVSTQQSEAKNEHVQKVLTPIPLTVLPPEPEVKQMSPPKVHPCSSVPSKKISIDINQIPQVSPQALRQEEIINVSSSHIISEGQENDANQVVHSSRLSTCSKKSLDKVLQKASLTVESRKDIDGIHVLKQGKQPGPSDLSFRSNWIPEVRHQIVGFEQEQTIDGTLRGQAVDLNDTPVIAAADVVPAEPGGNLISDKAVEVNYNSAVAGSQCVATQLIAELSKMWGENHSQSKCDFPRKDEASYLNEKPPNKVMNTTQTKESKQKGDQLVGSSRVKFGNECSGNQ
ncbi:At hook motif-containing protein [Thalictrum thalictroides]|uniref:At hook motif-containing protein n=1 Tax=Thalictrum thalictroides TaxID=46969 RepID=A0A7J6X8Z9_THATH|nr:At hook motif-containing protein [Thalictrum thalictroides]